jgi:hypothetical protein
MSYFLKVLYNATSIIDYQICNPNKYQNCNLDDYSNCSLDYERRWKVGSITVIVTWCP